MTKKKINWFSIGIWFVLIVVCIFMWVFAIKGVIDLFWTKKAINELDQRIERIENYEIYQ